MRILRPALALVAAAAAVDAAPAPAAVPAAAPVLAPEPQLDRLAARAASGLSAGRLDSALAAPAAMPLQQRVLLSADNAAAHGTQPPVCLCASSADDKKLASAHSKKHEEPLPAVEYWSVLAFIFVLVIVGGIVAGLTIGLMSLDETNLSILKVSGTATEKAYAERIEPIRKNTHLLLVTLLLTNTVVNETLPILFDAIHLQGWQAVLSSTVLIVIFGEIIPQAVCARYGLQIGAFFAWPVRILINLVWIIAYPIARLLDAVLGHKHGVVYRHAELKELVAMHGEDKSGPLTKDEVSVLRAVLELRDKSVRNIMTLLDDVFMLPLSAKLDLATMQSIIQAGHSRVPIYDINNRHRVIGVVLVKQLIDIDPDEEISIRSIKIRSLPRVLADTPLFEMLHIFEEGGSHMALVVEEVDIAPDQNSEGGRGYDDVLIIPSQSDGASSSSSGAGIAHGYHTLGIVTLEDVIEELLGEEIIDETDVYVDMATKVKVANSIRKQTEFSHLLMSPRILAAENRSQQQQQASNDDLGEADAERQPLLTPPFMFRQWSSPVPRIPPASSNVLAAYGTVSSPQPRSGTPHTQPGTSPQSSQLRHYANNHHVSAQHADVERGERATADASVACRAADAPSSGTASTGKPYQTTVKGVLDTSSLAPIPVSQKHTVAAALSGKSKRKKERERDMVPAQDLASMLALNPALVAPRRVSALASSRASMIQVDEDAAVTSPRLEPPSTAAAAAASGLSAIATTAATITSSLFGAGAAAETASGIMRTPSSSGNGLPPRAGAHGSRLITIESTESLTSPSAASAAKSTPTLARALFADDEQASQDLQDQDPPELSLGKPLQDQK
ncbi:hypothetical protein HK105_204346 [Polyrhizophydium stewartii]|uniref:CNNM transmembrane domain-containing protein n=1 Tax=Polyrhizophydium stewartii TaxID=2732419 RepID=A0ABR4N9N7_9FUNG